MNQVRADHGLPPYRYNGTLAAAAQNQANWMAANVTYRHTGAGGSSPQDRANAVGYNGYVSENIVEGTGMIPARYLVAEEPYSLRDDGVDAHFERRGGFCYDRVV